MPREAYSTYTPAPVVSSRALIDPAALPLPSARSKRRHSREVTPARAGSGSSSSPHAASSSASSSQSSVYRLTHRFPTPPLRYHSSPDTSVASTASSSPRKSEGGTKQLSPSPLPSPPSRTAARPRDTPQAAPPPGAAPTPAQPTGDASPATIMPERSPSQSRALATTARKPITIRPQLGGPRVSASLLAKGIPVPVQASGKADVRNGGSSPRQLRGAGDSVNSSGAGGGLKPLLLCDKVAGQGDASRQAIIIWPSSPRARGRPARAAQREQEELERDGAGAERRRYEAEADTMFSEARFRALLVELGI